MITLITGVPGMGKTSLVVSMMLEELAKGDRPFFVMGIPDLKLDYSPCPPVSEWVEQRPSVEDPSVIEDHFTFPPNSIIIVDECQKVYRPRASGSKVPPHVAAFETHRHRGLDFWLMTQKPTLLDSNVRDLVGRHIHIKDGKFFGRDIYEWREYADVKNKSNFEDAAKRPFKPPQKAFSLYKSSELHTKQPARKIHQAFFFLAIALAFTAYQGFNVFQNFAKHTGDKDENPISVVDSVGLITPASAGTSEPRQDFIKPTAPAVPPEPEHPFKGYRFQIAGQITSASRDVIFFHLAKDGAEFVDITSDELRELGYEIRQANHCSAFLFFKGAGVVASCSRNEDAPLRGSSPAASVLGI